jgi:CRISPR-associated protein Cas1
MTGPYMQFPLTGTVQSTGDAARGCIPIERRAKLPESHSRFLHVAEQGTVLRRAGTRVVVTSKQEILLEVSAMKLQGVLVYGNVQVSTQCLRALLDEGVWLSFFTRNGIYKGRLQPPCERGGRLRARQFERARDPEFALQFSRAVVRGKILSEREMGRRYASNYLAETLGEGYRILRESLERVESTADVAELRGVEGAATRAYFDMFRRWNRSGIAFEGREKRGASDPINALLNFGYTLVTRELEGLTEAAGLDPAVGFYHTADYDRPSLACDWVEEFRHLVVDRLVLNLINRGTIKADGFEEAPGKGLRMKQDALRRFVTAYERLMTGSAEQNGEDKVGAAPPAYRTVFLDQLGRLLDALSEREMYRSHLEP